MQTVKCPLVVVRKALRASAIEVQDMRYTGKKRRCATVGRYMMTVGVPTITTAVFVQPRAILWPSVTIHGKTYVKSVAFRG